MAAALINRLLHRMSSRYRGTTTTRALLWQVFALTSSSKPATPDATYTYRPSGQLQDRVDAVDIRRERRGRGAGELRDGDSEQLGVTARARCTRRCGAAGGRNADGVRDDRHAVTAESAAFVSHAFLAYRWRALTQCYATVVSATPIAPQRTSRHAQFTPRPEQRQLFRSVHGIGTAPTRPSSFR